LTAGGDPSAQQCGWLKDRYGLSWQVVPVALAKLMTDPDTRKSDRVMTALLQMKKLDIAALQRASAAKT
jgi:predicted 3-demethylubiquinone-9 3-methyltransferase (glyoxalase superfamily)